jgi:hypothetical protein
MIKPWSQSLAGLYLNDKGQCAENDEQPRFLNDGKRRRHGRLLRQDSCETKKPSSRKSHGIASPQINCNEMTVATINMIRG